MTRILKDLAFSFCGDEHVVSEGGVEGEQHRSEDETGPEYVLASHVEDERRYEGRNAESNKDRDILEGVDFVQILREAFRSDGNDGAFGQEESDPEDESHNKPVDDKKGLILNKAKNAEEKGRNHDAVEASQVHLASAEAMHQPIEPARKHETR